MHLVERQLRDPFREVPLRYLGYTNEVGEAFRHVVPVRWVYISYLVSSGYVAGHAIQQGYRAKYNDGMVSHSSVYKPKASPSSSAVAVTETLVWQGLASVVIPGFTINRICALTRTFLNHRRLHRMTSPVINRWIITAVGLGSIPFIIEPIDRLVDQCMDTCGRPLIKKFFS